MAHGPMLTDHGLFTNRKWNAELINYLINEWAKWNKRKVHKHREIWNRLDEIQLTTELFDSLQKLITTWWTW